jgi:rare lipoprotein A
MSWRIGAAAGLVFVCGLASGEAPAQNPKTISGIAAYYSKDYQGTTASGELYDPNKFTAAHPTLPFGTRVLVTDPKTHRSVVVTVNDRGPHSKKLVLDLSWAAAEELHMIDRGIIDITAVVLPDDARK